MTCPNFNIGEFDKRIVIERLVKTPDGIGGNTEVWTANPAGGVWARLRNLTGSERWEAQRIMPGNLIRAIIRYRGDSFGNPFYTVDDRVVYRGRIYAILAVFDIDWEQKYIQIDMQEGKP